MEHNGIKGFGRPARAIAMTRCSSLVAAALISILPVQVQAETLNGALAAAYKFNPEIEAERANLRATDEGVPIAKSGYRPTINATGQLEASRSRTDPGGVSGLNTAAYQLNFSQNLFKGFQVYNQVSAAEARVRAERATLHSTEQAVLLQAATAYMNVVRDQAIVRLRENNVTVLSRNLKATQDRFTAGEVTRTDVAQSQARRAGAVSDLDLARANLKSSRANYERVIGHQPSRLASASVPHKNLPKTLDTARHLAMNESPLVIASLYLEESARHEVEAVWGQLLPSLTLNAQFAQARNPTNNIDSLTSGSVTGNITIPIYSAGLVRAQVRQAKHLHVARLQLVGQARTQAREAAVTAWAALNASNAQLISDKAQVDANRVALTGVREEEKVGQRTLLDVLNAEQELLNSQVNLVTTQRDQVVNAYTLIAAVGRLTAKELGLSSKLYDEEAHYFEVRRKWFGISITYQDGHQEHIDVWNTRASKNTYK